ncbi:phospholipase-like protein [Tanacetum coccineum]|uniref:Phospholipase-like protein n=1 Tax=Tanacetum coccineum TaxID=301880 RepID=A0ABQ5FH03_9ASTR
MFDLYDVKISVRSSVKLLLEIKGLLSMKPNRENLFRDTVFGSWLDIQSHENDSHMMHYGKYMWEKFYSRTVNVVSRHTEHHLAQLKKNPNFNATYNLYGFAWAFKIWILESYPNSKNWCSKKANVIPCGLAWSKVTMFEKSDYEELFRPMSNLNVPLIASPKEMSHAWFKDSAEFIKSLDAQDGTFLHDDQCREKSMEQHNGMCGDTEDDDGDGVWDSQTKNVIEEASMLPTMSSNSPQARNAAVSEFFDEFDALKKEVLLIKQRKDDEFYELTKRFSKLETFETFVKFKKLLTNDLCTKNESNDCNPKKCDGGVSIEEKPNFSSHHNDSSNHIGSVSSEEKASSSFAHPRNDEDVSHLADNMEIDGPNAKDLYSNSQHHLHLLIKGLGTKIENPSIDSVLVVPPKVDDPMLRTIKPKDDFDEADVDSNDDDYMSMFNDEEQPSLGRGLGTLKFKKKNCERSLRPNYVLRFAKIRKKKMAMSLKSTPVPTKRKTRLNKIEDIVMPYDLENLSRPDGCKSDKVTVPEYMSTFIKNKDLLEYRFPWDKRDIVIGRSFWLSLSCLNIGKSGWLTDQVYFPVNEPKQHWCLAQLEIHTGVVTFYDLLGWAGGSRRRWWRRMKKVLPEKLTLYLLMHGIFDSKGISADHYKITYNYAYVSFQALLYGGCGIWVCIFIYRLCHNLPVAVDNDPLETALAYHERMLEFFSNHKILVEKTSSFV